MSTDTSTTPPSTEHRQRPGGQHNRAVAAVLPRREASSGYRIDRKHVIGGTRKPTSRWGSHLHERFSRQLAVGKREVLLVTWLRHGRRTKKRHKMKAKRKCKQQKHHRIKNRTTTPTYPQSNLENGHRGCRSRDPD